MKKDREIRGERQRLSIKSDSMNLDPIREKLKQWQISHGRAKENLLPWQRRGAVKNTQDAGCKEKEVRNLLRRSENRYDNLKQDSEVQDRRQQLQKWLEEKKAKLNPLKASSSRDLTLNPRINCTSSLTTVQSQIATESCKPSVNRPKMPPKPIVNFIERNKLNVKNAGEKLKRRTTVADIQINCRRRSIDKLKKHHAMQNTKYFCCKRSSKKLNNLNRKFGENGKKAGASPQLTVNGNIDNSVFGSDPGWATNEKFCVNKEMLQASNVGNEPVTKVVSSQDSDECKRDKESSRVDLRGKQELTGISQVKESNTNPLLPDDNLNLAQIISPRVKFVLSPIHHLPHLNVYTITPVRRSLRLSSTPSANHRPSRLVDSVGMIPCEIRPNVIYKRNPALNF